MTLLGLSRISASASIAAGILAMLVAGTTGAFIHPSKSSRPGGGWSSLTRGGGKSTTGGHSFGTALFDQDPNRARTERLLEESMGDDWRLFRAKLVAKERAERRSLRAAENRRFTQQRFGGGGGGSYNGHNVHNSMSRGNGYNGHNGGSQRTPFVSRPQSQSSRRAPLSGRNTIAAFHDERLARQEQMSNMFQSDIAPILSAENQICTQDPFLSEAEIPIHLQSSPIPVDKHRWAHPIEHIEPGCVLIANEMIGGAFHQTIILVVEHHPNTGSAGIVINRPIGGNVEAVASKHDSNLDKELKRAFQDSPVAYGGPSNPDSYSILHGFGRVAGSKKLAPGVFIGGFEELMDEVNLGRFDVSDALFVKGYTEWGAGQLENEVRKGQWYPAAASSDLILRYANAPMTEQDNPNDLWSDILVCIGGDYEQIAREFGGIGDNRLSP